MRDPARRTRKPAAEIEVVSTANDPIEQMAREDRRARKVQKTVAYLRHELWRLEKEHEFRRAQARRQLVAIAQDLLPKAAGLARKGRPRLLAICAKIIGDPQIDAANFLGGTRPATVDEMLPPAKE